MPTSRGSASVSARSSPRAGRTSRYCDVAGIAPDAVTVDALAQLQLGARRHGCTVRLQNASDELRALVEFMGLTAVLPS